MILFTSLSRPAEARNGRPCCIRLRPAAWTVRRRLTHPSRSSSRGAFEGRTVSRLFAVLFALAFCTTGATEAQRVEPQPSEVFDEAFRMYSDGLYSHAAAAFESFRLTYPSDIRAADALYYEAESRLGAGETAAATDLFRDFQAAWPGSELARKASLALGQYHFESGEYDQAIETFADFLLDDPPADQGARALYFIGESMLKQGRDAEAVTYFQRSADEYPDTEVAPTALYAVAFTELRRDRYAEAARALETLSVRYPSSPRAGNVGLTLAEVYYELGEYRRAVAEAERRVNGLTGVEEERAVFLLAESHNQQRQSEEAIVYYRRITENSPDSPFLRRALYGLAWNYYFEGAHQWAADEFAKAAEGYDDELAQRAVYYEAVNRKLGTQDDEAIRLFEESAERWPNGIMHEKALFELGVALYEDRNWERAGATFDRLIAAHPDGELSGQAYNFRASTHIAMGNFDEALADFDGAIERSVVDPAVRDEMVFQKAWTLFRTEAYSSAVPAFLQIRTDNPDGPHADEALFWAGESNYQVRRYDDAARQFTQYLQENPNGEHVDAARYALGWTFFKQARYDEAIRYFESFLAGYSGDDSFVPYREDARLRLGDSYFASKRYTEAVRVYRLAAADENDYAQYQVGQAYKNAGDYASASREFAKLLADYIDSGWREEAQYSLGDTYFQAQDYPAAVGAFEKLIAESPTDPLAPKAQYSIGDAYFNSGELNRAVSAYRRVLEQYPRSVFAGDAASSLLFAYVALDDEASADAFVDSFAVANPNSPIVDQLRFKQAEVKFQSGRTDEALAAFQQFVQGARDEDLLPEAYFYLGSIFQDREQYAEAESYLRQIVIANSSHPRKADAAEMLGHIYLEQRRSQDALTMFREYRDLARGNEADESRARYGEAMALLQLGQTEAAELLLREAVEDAGAEGDFPALLGLARVYDDTGRASEATAAYRRVVSQSQNEHGAEALVRLGEMLVRTGRTRDAVEELGRLPVLFGGYPDWLARGYLAQARAFVALGATGDATRTFDLLIDQYGDTPEAAVASREKAAL